MSNNYDFPKKSLDGNKFVVLYKRDMPNRKENMMLYDRAKGFGKKKEAMNYAMAHTPAIIIRTAASTIKHLEKYGDNYIVAAEFYGKYEHTDYTGDSDWLTTYDATRTTQSQLEQTIQTFSKEAHLRRMFVGLEIKLM